MHLDPSLQLVVTISILIVGMSLLMRLLKQPHVVGYLLVGVLVGPQGLGWIQDREVLDRLGAIGVVLLLFFVGMEASPQKLIAGWRITIVGTLLQIAITTGIVGLLGLALDWSLPRILLIGFATSLSSTAVVLKILKDSGQLETQEGQSALGVLLAQDVLFVPMLVIIGLSGGEKPGVGTTTLQVGGGIAFVATLVWLARGHRFRLPMGKVLRADHEMQMFAALTICLGLSLLSGLLHLSTALGAFLGGMIVGAARETDWFHRSLEPFRIVAVAIFFVSIGMLVDIDFLRLHWWKVSLVVVTVLLTNTFVNAVILRLLRVPWPKALFTAALLAQIGEFSFVLAALGRQLSILTDYVYAFLVAVIAISLTVSPAWISLFRRLTSKTEVAD